MLPIFGDERRRQINLGGASSASTHTAILDQAKARRNERQEQKRRQENATRIQAWWRGVQDAKTTRIQMRRMFEEDVTGITGLRCLVLTRDEEVLGKWSSTIVQRGEEALFAPAREQQSSWLVLIRQATLLLLQSVSRSPNSNHAVTHLQILNLLLAPAATTRAFGALGPSLTAQITQYLSDHGFYSLLAEAIRSIPLGGKASSKSLPLLAPLATYPFSTFSPGSSYYTQSYTALLSSIFTIPLIPNRLPLTTLSEFSARLPLANLSVLDLSIPMLTELETEPKIHLVANLLVFTSPRYSSLPPDALSTYLRILSAIINSLPISALDPPAKRTSTTTSSTSWIPDDPDDSDAEEAQSTRVSVVSNFAVPARVPLPSLDARTLKRLKTLPSPAHINSLLKISQSNTRPALIAFFLALTTVWPAERSKTLSTVLVYTGGGLVRELYRVYVRGSPIGRDDSSGALMDPAHASSWAPLLFLCDLYTQSLLTMGDDEFFGTSPSAGARNPLTLDDLTSFSRQLLNIAFTLYWREDPTNVQGGSVGGEVRCTWENVREKVTKCLLGIHARDSRKSFCPPSHWLIGSQIDMQSFVEAAIFEEQQLSIAGATPSRPLSKRQIAYLSPRLGVLNNIPFSIPFEVRISIFRHFIVSDMVARGMTGNRHTSFGKRTRVQVRRGSVAQDGFDRLAEADLKAPIEITFIDQFGQEEAGIDGGGVFKEFFTDLCKEVFDTDRGLWMANKENELYPNPHAYATEPHSLNWYRFIGRILGKAMYEGILVDVGFAGFFLAKWLGKQSFLDDLASLDPELYNGLIFLKHYAGNPEDLSLNFTVAVEEFGVTKTIDLVPNGSNISVTRENRLQYIHLVSYYRLTKQIKLQSEAFFEGLSDMIDPKWLRMFNQQEVQILLGGVNAPIDLEDLRTNTQYGGLYDDHQPTVEAFWNVVESFDQDQRRALLRFVTSCSRPPLLGFKELVPNFAIRDAGEDQFRLPTSSTCVNLLKLPRYKSENVLRDKLLQAINSGAGFDLS